MKVKITKNLLTQLQSKEKFEIGLLVGLKLETADEYLIRYLVQTPSEDKPIDGLFSLSSDWFGNHANQVSTMMNASHVLLGMYTYGDTDNVNKRSDVIALLMKSIPIGTNERSLYHIHVEQNRHTSKKYSFSSGKKNADVSEANIKAADQQTIHTIDSVLQLSVSIPVKQPLLESADQLSKPLRDLCTNALRGYITDLFSSSIFLIDGKIVDANQKVNSGNSIQIYSRDRVPADSDVRTAGYFYITGKIHGVASVTPKSTMQSAIRQLQDDITSSILNRFELLCDELQASSDTLLEKKVFQESGEYKLPSRYFADSELSFCDYAFSNESEQDVKNRIADILSIEATAVLSRESELKKATTKQSTTTAGTSLPKHSTTDEGNIVMRFILYLLAIFTSLFATKQKN